MGTWDEPSGKTGSGKKFFHNIIPGSAVATQEFYVAIITPVIHYCMGGLQTTVDGECIKGGKALPGLYVAGEAAGGVRGNNRLGGNSLLDCVVFGRVAGKHCSQYMLGDDFKSVSLDELSGGGLTGAVEGSKHAGGSYEDKMNQASSKAKSTSGGGLAAGGGGASKKYPKAGTKNATPDKAGVANTTPSCWNCFVGPSNSASKLRSYLIKIDLLKTSAESDIECLSRAAHSKTKHKSITDYGPVVGEDYNVLLNAVFDYVYKEYADAKRARNDDIVHPAELDVIKAHVKEALDPENKKVITLAAMKASIKKLVDENDYSETCD